MKSTSDYRKILVWKRKVEHEGLQLEPKDQQIWSQEDKQLVQKIEALSYMPNSKDYIRYFRNFKHNLTIRTRVSPVYTRGDLALKKEI